jgi:hypothetical protein
MNTKTLWWSTCSQMRTLQMQDITTEATEEEELWVVCQRRTDAVVVHPLADAHPAQYCTFTEAKQQQQQQQTVVVCFKSLKQWHLQGSTQSSAVWRHLLTDAHPAGARHQRAAEPRAAAAATTAKQRIACQHRAAVVVHLTDAHPVIFRVVAAAAAAAATAATAS